MDFLLMVGNKVQFFQTLFHHFLDKLLSPLFFQVLVAYQLGFQLELHQSGGLILSKRENINLSVLGELEYCISELKVNSHFSSETLSTRWSIMDLWLLLYLVQMYDLSFSGEVRYTWIVRILVSDFLLRTVIFMYLSPLLLLLPVQ